MPPGAACGLHVLACSGALFTGTANATTGRGTAQCLRVPPDLVHVCTPPDFQCLLPRVIAARMAQPLWSGTRPARMRHAMCGPSNAVSRLCRKPHAEGGKSWPSAPFRPGHACERTAGSRPCALGRHRANGHRQAVNGRDMLPSSPRQPRSQTPCYSAFVCRHATAAPQTSAAVGDV